MTSPRGRIKLWIATKRVHDEGVRVGLELVKLREENQALHEALDECADRLVMGPCEANSGWWEKARPLLGWDDDAVA